MAIGRSLAAAVLVGAVSALAVPEARADVTFRFGFGDAYGYGHHPFYSHRHHRRHHHYTHDLFAILLPFLAGYELLHRPYYGGYYGYRYWHRPYPWPPYPRWRYAPPPAIRYGAPVRYYDAPPVIYVAPPGYAYPYR